MRQKNACVKSAKVTTWASSRVVRLLLSKQSLVKPNTCDLFS
jgi:hypothetical protein